MNSVPSRSVARLLVGVAGAALALSANVAWAEDAPAATDSSGESTDGEILVIGSTRELQRSMDVPIAVTAFSGDDLQSKSATKFSDIAAYTPGFSVSPAPGNATAITLSLRGQVQTDILATLEPSVGTYVDDLYWGRAYGLNANLLDVASAQVLKGPQGTLFGRNTTGGALVITSADPNTDGLSGRASFTYGRFNELTGEAAVNIPLGDRIAVRGAFRLSGRDGWAHGVRLVDPAGAFNNSAAATNVVVPNGRRYNDLQQIQGRVKVLFKVSDSTNLVLAGEWYDYRSDGPARQMIYKVQLNTPGSAGDQVVALTGVNRYVGAFVTDPDAVGVDAFDCSYANNQTLNCSGGLVRNRTPYTIASTATYSGRLTSDFDFGTFKLIGGWRNVKTSNFIDLDGSSTLIHATSLEQDLSQWSVEGNLSGSLMGDRLDYVVGATYFHEDGFDLSYSLTGAAGNVPNRATRNFAFIDNDSFGAYTQLHFNVTDTIALTGGIRYSEDTKGIDIRSANVNILGQLTGLAGNVYPTGYVSGGLFDPCNASGAGIIAGATPANDCSVAQSAKFSSVSWTAGIDFKPNDDLLFYAKISKGYRSGGHNLRAFNTAQFVPFKPETVLEQEVGFKAQLADRRVLITVAGYHNELTDAQRTTIVTTGAVSNTVVGNAAKTRTYGVEGELLVRPAPGLSFSASGSITDVKYLSYADAAGDHTNERFSFVPKYKFTLGGEYEFQLSGSLSARLNVDYTWQSETASNQCTVTGASACWTGSADINGRTTAQIAQDIFNATNLPAAGILGARLTFGLDDEKYTFSIWGRNITDNRSFVQALSLNAPNRNYVSGLRRDPATYGVTAAVKF